MIESSLCDTQKEAIDAGEELAKKDTVDLIIRVRDGIRNKDSYGSDPNPPKDKEH